MKKKYLISEEQFRMLIQLKREEKTVNKILEDVTKVKKNLNESRLLESGIVDVLKKYRRKGILTESILNSLLKKGITEDQIKKAKN
jgi:predicted RNase H-like nuclease